MRNVNRVIGVLAPLIVTGLSGTADAAMVQSNSVQFSYNAANLGPFGAPTKDDSVGQNSAGLIIGSPDGRFSANTDTSVTLTPSRVWTLKITAEAPQDHVITGFSWGEIGTYTSNGSNNTGTATSILRVRDSSSQNIIPGGKATEKQALDGATGSAGEPWDLSYAQDIENGRGKLTFIIKYRLNASAGSGSMATMLYKLGTLKVDVANAPGRNTNSSFSVPVPPALWLFGSAVVALAGGLRRSSSS